MIVRMRTNVMRVLAIIAAVVVLRAVTFNAGAITWGTATTISTDTDVSTSGQLVSGYHFGSGFQLINSTYFAPDFGDITLGNLGLPGGMSSASDPYNSLTAVYKNILNIARTGSAGTSTVTLRNLVVGHNYQVQLWINDSRGSTASQNRKGDLSSMDGNTVNLDYNTTDSNGGVGQYSIGTFTADAATQLISIVSSAPQLNCIQLRDLSEPRNFIWDTPVTITGDSDVSTNGTLLYAYSLGNTSPTVNTVPFVGDTSPADMGGNITSGFGGVNSTAFGSASEPFNSLSAEYKQILVGGSELGGNTRVTVTLQNLTAGNRYQVQAWVSDARGGAYGSRWDWYAGPNGVGPVPVRRCSTGVAGSPGQYVIGTFVANSTSQQFTILGSSTMLSAIQVRYLPGPPSGTVIMIR